MLTIPETKRNVPQQQWCSYVSIAPSTGARSRARTRHLQNIAETRFLGMSLHTRKLSRNGTRVWVLGSVFMHRPLFVCLFVCLSVCVCGWVGGRLLYAKMEKYKLVFTFEDL